MGEKVTKPNERMKNNKRETFLFDRTPVNNEIKTTYNNYIYEK